MHASQIRVVEWINIHLGEREKERQRLSSSECGYFVCIDNQGFRVKIIIILIRNSSTSRKTRFFYFYIYF